MIAHIAEFHAPVNVLETIGMDGFRQRVVPVLEQQPGFEGYLIVLSRDKQELLGITLWDTEENGKSAAARLEQERLTGVDEMNAESPAPDLYEVLAKL